MLLEFIRLRAPARVELRIHDRQQSAYLLEGGGPRIADAACSLEGRGQLGVALCALRSSIRVGTFCQDQLGKIKVDLMKSRYVWFGGKQEKNKTQLSDIKPPVGKKTNPHRRKALQRDRGSCRNNSRNEEETWKTTVLFLRGMSAERRINDDPKKQPASFHPSHDNDWDERRQPLRAGVRSASLPDIVGSLADSCG